MYKLIPLLFLILFAGCMKNDDAEPNCDYNPCGRVAPASEVASVRSYLATQTFSDTVQHCSGIFYRILSPGTGQKPNVCSVITFKYRGMLTNGNVFDESTTGITYQLSQLIAGWQNTLPLIGEGGRMMLYIPPSFGYGNQQVGTIPPNSILVFEIELVDVQ